LRQIQVYLGGDPAATDASRILRLRGTLNHKYKPARPVTVHTMNDFAYDIEDLVADLPGGGDASEPSKVRNFNKKDTYTFSIEGGTSSPHTESTRSPHEPTRVHTINFSEGHRDESLFHVATCCLKGGMDPLIAEELLHFLASRCSPPFPEKEANEKVRSALKRAQTRERSISEEVREWVLESTGVHFESPQLYRELDLSTRVHKRAALEALRRLRLERIIEPASEKRGHYRVVSRECEDIDFLNASGGEINVTWPLEIEKLFQIYPKNIITIAGDPDSGKTALLLNVAKLNMDNHDIHYLISEMGAQELRTRLALFADLPLERWRFHPKERASNFQDVIVPDGFNIIDFLEIHDNFYQIGGMLKAIHDKLRNGIAVIAIQKARGAQLGRGGSFSLEKPRLYLTLSRDGEGNVATIEKCKNWRTTTNPNGLQRRFKLYQGTKFMPTSDWQRPA
jgi:hypothetical protein